MTHINVIINIICHVKKLKLQSCILFQQSQNTEDKYDN